MDHLLAEQGRLSYDECLPTYFPQFPAWGADISVRHLLHHTSGLPHYVEFFSACTSVPEFTREVFGVTNEAVLERATELGGPEFLVGTKFLYGGTAYTLLALIVGIVSGRSFAEFLKANVFDPLGMKHTVVYDQSRPHRHKLAHGYLLEKGEFERWDYPMLTAGDGGLFSTLDDMFLWDQVLNTERLVSKTALEQAFTSGTTNDGTSVGYGFGWYTDVFPYLNTAERAQLSAVGGADVRHVAHGGGCVAYHNYMIRLLETRRTILVLANFGPIAPAQGPGSDRGIPGPRVRAHRVAEILFSD